MKQYQIVPSERFQKDLKRASLKGYRMPQILRAIRLLAAGATVETEYRDRAMLGKYSSYRECKVEAGCVLVYRYSGDKLILYFLKLSGTWRNAFMFTLTEIKYQLFRNRGRSILLVLIAALLTACMAFYVGNILSADQALNTLGDQIPVEIRVTNLDGSISGGIRLESEKYDALIQTGVKDIRCSAAAAGALSEDAQNIVPFEGGDTRIYGVNCIEAAGIPATLFTFAENTDCSFLEGDEPLCAVDELFAENEGVSIGDEISLPVYLYAAGMGYLPIEQKAVLKIAATYGAATGAGNSNDLIVPVQWLRNTLVKNGGTFFCYDSFSATVDDPLRLNSFKEKIKELGYLPQKASLRSDDDFSEGGAVLIEDEIFIKTAIKLRENLAAYRRFLVPFFVLIITLISLSIFLVLRNSRLDMAIASSLGISKLQSVCGSFFSVLLADLFGCLLALPVLYYAAGIPLSAALAVCGFFLACACIGTALSLGALLRFDTLELLTKVD